MKIRYLGQQDFLETWRKMHDFTENRDQNTEDELWILEHSAVFTQGLAGKPEHILHPHDIAVVQTDRGGQATYHGPGQIIAYVLYDLKRANIGVRSLVTKLEQSIIQLLTRYGVQANSECARPGVYVNSEKIASIGLRVKKGCSYHGISFNVDMDLTPFTFINPCGYKQLKMTQLKTYLPSLNMTNIQSELADCIEKQLHSSTEPGIISNPEKSCGALSDS